MKNMNEGMGQGNQFQRKGAVDQNFHAKQKENSMMQMCFGVVSRLLLGLLGSLRAKFHHAVDQRVGRDNEDHDNSSVSPAIVVMVDIKSRQVIASRPELAYFAHRRGIWVE